jgi:hypothetical protein
MRFVSLFSLFIAVLFTSCKSSPPPSAETAGEMARKRVAEEKREPGEVLPDYTVDWRRIADLAGKTEYDPYITNILWRRLNWRAYLSGKAFTELAADLEREYKWDKRIRDWEAKRKPAEPAGESGEDSESQQPQKK